MRARYVRRERGRERGEREREREERERRERDGVWVNCKKYWQAYLTLIFSVVARKEDKLLEGA